MNFLKSITAAALLATAISTGAMSMAFDGKEDLATFTGKVNLALVNDADSTLTITEDLINAKADLKTYTSTHGTKLVKENLEKLAHSLAAMIETLENAAGTGGKAEVLKYVKAEADAGRAVQVTLSKTFKMALPEDKLTSALNKAVGSVAAALDPVTQTQKDLEELMKYSSKGKDKVFVDASKKEYTIEELLAEYKGADKTKKGTTDTLVGTLKTKKGKTLAQIILDSRDEFKHVKNGQEADHIAFKKKLITDMQLTDEQQAGVDFLAKFQPFLEAGYITYEKDITDPANIDDFITVIQKTIEKIASLEQDLEDMTAERDGALAKAATGTGPAIPSFAKGKPDSTPTPPKGSKDVTAAHASKHAAAESMGAGAEYLAKHNLTIHGGKFYGK